MERQYRRHAERRAGLHQGHPTHRPLSDQHDVVGLSGEIALAEYLGLAVDTRELDAGDGGRDFETAFGSIDVKTFRKPFNLLVEQGKVLSTYYVLAGYREIDERADLIGWASGAAVRIAPTRDFGYGVISHYIPAGKLKRMDLLRVLCRRNAIRESQ